MLQKSISLVECPRDAMQGWHRFISTNDKIRYIQSLLHLGFDTIDFGSFVSPKAIPQMADTSLVLKGLQLTSTSSKLLAIIANVRGAEEAVLHDEISYLGFPFSISPTFQFKNTNSTLDESLNRVDEIQELCIKNNKTLVVYLSMAFGNPYGDAYDSSILYHWANEMIAKNISIISLADTVGLASPNQISEALNALIPHHQDTVFGVHLHSQLHDFTAKIAAAKNAGCSRFDGAIKGIGGCPMAQNDLVGNIATEQMINWFNHAEKLVDIDMEGLEKSIEIATEIFV
ncbi:MAG: hydroxymethylglutaryl-CoA lyase [Chitinophagaceae bacterium]